MRSAAAAAHGMSLKIHNDGWVCCAASPTIWDVVHVSLVVVVCVPFPVLLSFLFLHLSSLSSGFHIPERGIRSTRLALVTFKKASIACKFKLGYGSPGTKSKECFAATKIGGCAGWNPERSKNPNGIYGARGERQKQTVHGVVVEDWNS